MQALVRLERAAPTPGLSLPTAPAGSCSGIPPRCLNGSAFSSNGDAEQAHRVVGRGEDAWLPSTAVLRFGHPVELGLQGRDGQRLGEMFGFTPYGARLAGP